MGITYAKETNLFTVIYAGVNEPLLRHAKYCQAEQTVLPKNVAYAIPASRPLSFILSLTHDLRLMELTVF